MDIYSHSHVHSHRHHWQFFAAYMSVFVVLAIIGYYMSVKPGHSLTSRMTSAASSFATDLTYYDLPRISVVVGENGRETNIRVDMTLEVEKRNLAIVEGYQPRITAKLNRFLMTVDPERVQDVKWLPWLRSEMLSQVNSVGDPAPVHDLMFRQLMVMM